MEERIKGSNLHGNKNEELLVKYLDGKKLSDLNTNMKNFINFIIQDKEISFAKEDTIKSYLVTNNKFKQDIIIVLQGEEYNVSVKMGTGNSVHQEKIEDFINYLKNAYNISETLANDFRLSIWVDGTLDGKGDVNNRFKISKLKELYPKSKERIQKFLNENRKGLITHFIKVGRHNSHVDYIYHGSINNGSWISIDQLINYNLDYAYDLNKARAALPIGRMSIQPWNPVLNGNPKTEHKRGQVQVKYTSMENDFAYLIEKNSENKGTYLGDKEEFTISQVLNKNKKHKFWKAMNLHNKNSNLYAIKVSSNVVSCLSGKKVLPKADVYIVEAEIGRNYLLSKEYHLDENDLNDFKYKIIKESGISVKRKDSKSYTFAKFTPNTFKKLFEEREDSLILSLSVFLYIKEAKDNIKILQGLGLTEEDLWDYLIAEGFTKTKGDITDKNEVKYIKKYLNNKMRKVIENNPSIKAAIFAGKGLYEEPYPASFIVKHGELTNEIVTEYSITRGSGLSKGNYTIIFKP